MSDSKQQKPTSESTKAKKEEPKQEPKVEAEAETKDSKTKKTEKDTLRFQLKSNKPMWNSPSGNIKLSAFRQETGGTVSKKSSPEDFNAVQNAIRLDLLEEVPEGKEFIKFESKNLTAGASQAEKEAKVKKDYNTDEYLNMKQDEVLPKVRDIEDPKLLIALIQAEKKGKNESNVERPNVLTALRERLNAIDKQGIFEYEGEI